MILNSFGKFFENQEVGEWLTSKEAAQVLGISPNALRILACRGRVKFFKLNGRLRFRGSDLKVLLRKGA
jgi:excisionase family DNA binding protein